MTKQTKKQDVEATMRTELVFILDRSGSMGGLENDTIGGFNSMLEKQRKIEGECRITTVLFDNVCELLHDRIDIAAIAPITENEYYVRGSTALVDAIGFTIDKIVKAQRHTAENHRAEKVMCVIITDGYENASHKYSLEHVRDKITHETEKYGWEFIFLGANIDAIETAGHYGIRSSHAADYSCDSDGVALNFITVSNVLQNVRHRRAYDMDEALTPIRKSHEERGGEK